MEDEHIAYALQLSGLSPEAKDTLFGQEPVVGPVGVDELGDKVLMFSANVFALSSWLHFDQPGNGCASVQPILNDEINFADKQKTRGRDTKSSAELNLLPLAALIDIGQLPHVPRRQARDGWRGNHPTPLCRRPPKSFG